MSSSDGQERDAVAALFRSAVDDAPPASFDEQDVRARYRRTRRRRMSTVAGSALAVVLAAVLVPVLVLAGRPGGSAPPGALAAAPHASTTTPHRLSPFAQQLPGGPSEQGNGPHGRVGPQVDGTRSGCARVDRELATALEGELPVPADTAIPVPGGCPAGGRGAALPVHGATVAAVVLPAGVHPGPARQGNGDRQVRTAPSGATVEVFVSGGAPPALRAQLPAIADRLARGG